MSQETIQVAVTILDKEYLIACPADEEAGLRESARLLDEKMREIRKTGKVIGSERIAVMAALNLAHDLLQQSGATAGPQKDLYHRLQALQERIGAVLDQEDRQLKL